MALTCSDILEEARLALRHVLDPRINAVRFVNRVGSRWVGLHNWHYLSGRSTVIETVDGQSKYVLPRNLAELKSIHGDDETQPYVRLIPWEDFHRQVIAQYHLGYASFHGALNFENWEDEFLPVLHLTPAPTGVDNLSVLYRAGWKSISDEEQVLELPTWAEEAFLDLTRALALGLTRPSSAGNPDAVMSLVAQVTQGHAFMNAKSMDGGVQGGIRQSTGGLGEVLNRAQYSHGCEWGPQSTSQDLLADL